MAPDAPTYTLTDADRALIDRARSAFAVDPEYLIGMLWAARDRRRPTPEPEQVNPEPEPEPHPYVVLTAILEDLEPRLTQYVAYRRGCWVWSGGLSHGDQPVLRLGPANKVQPVRRWLYIQTHGPVSADRRVLAGSDCLVRCVNPDHGFVLPPGVQKRGQIRPVA